MVYGGSATSCSMRPPSARIWPRPSRFCVTPLVPRRWDGIRGGTVPERAALAILRAPVGTAQLGWYTGRDSPNTRRLLVEHGRLLYDADSYADDLPYWA